MVKVFLISKYIFRFISLVRVTVIFTYFVDPGTTFLSKNDVVLPLNLTLHISYV